MGGLDGGHPVPHRLVDRVLEGAAAALNRLDLAAKQLHPKDVQRLALHVDRAHVHLALHPQQGGDGGGGHPVLAGTGLGHQALLAHPLGQQALAEDVVYLVRAGVVEVLALHHQAQPQPATEVVALGEDRRPAGIGAQGVVEFGAKRRVGPGRGELDLELLARRDQGFGDEATTELTKASTGRRLGHQRHRLTPRRRPSRRASCRARGGGAGLRRGPSR